MDAIVAELNNIGVAYLEQGDLRMASDLFRDALRQTREDLPLHFAAAVRATQYAAAHPNPIGAAAYNFDHHPCEEYSSSSSILSSISGAAFLHGQGFCISAIAGAYSPHAIVNTAIISTLVIFNLAIVYHLQGLREQAVNDSKLAKARSLYSKAKLLLADAGAAGRSTGNAVIDLLAMSISNNLAHVSYELSRFEESRMHFERLVRFALTVLPTAYGEGTVASAMDKQKANFLLNAIILHAPTLAPAA